MEPLAPVNAALEAAGALPEGAWLDWLWRTDPEEPLSPAVLLNRSHLLGLLVCRQQARLAAPAGPVGAEAGARVRLLDTPPEAMTLRELRDTVDNLLLEWAPFLRRTAQNPQGPASLAAVVRLVDGCFARLGRLAETPGPPAVFNDSGGTEPHDAVEGGLLRLTRPCLRRLLNAFLVLYRHLHLLTVAEEVPPEPYDCGVCRHHLEASQDEYHELCMSMALPVAARITYKLDFPGMYNHVVYFHNPQYERTPRVPFERLAEAEPVHVLPALRQLRPTIEVRYEEDHVDLAAGPGRWLWLVVPGRVYLAGPDGRVYHSPDVTALLRVHDEAAV